MICRTQCIKDAAHSGNTINRFSSRRQRLDHAFLRERLRRATSYKRIAGYFRSSIFELVGEEIAAIPDVRILCNSELDAADIAVSQAAREKALQERWNRLLGNTTILLYDPSATGERHGVHSRVI